MTNLEKLMKIKKTLLEIELDCIDNKGSCPYEIAYAIRTIDEAIEAFQTLN